VNLSETGESRVNGYLFVLERSLKMFLPPEVVRDAVREIDSHLRERVLSADGAPNERDALEKILAELGPPLRVAQAYSAERTIDEAVTTGRIVPMARAVWHLATTTLLGFAVAFLLLGLMKPIFPNNVGFWVPDTPDGRIPWRLGADFPGLKNEHVVGGYWVVPLCLGLGFVLLVVTHRCARRFLTWWRERRFS
jgi:hypothetical protein